MRTLLLLLIAMTASAAERALPRYDVRVKLDTAAHHATIVETITWTNNSNTPTRELVLNFYPQFRIPQGDHLLLAKTLELLRLNPSYGIDRNGRAGRIDRVTCDGALLEYTYRHDNNTAVTVALPKAVGPGESVTVTVEAQVQLPNKQGRWGHWLGVHALVNSLPVVAYHDAGGFHAMPFVPWHQPFFNDAGVWTAAITLPNDETLACSAPVNEVMPNADGTKTITTNEFTGRDFAILCSKEFKEYTSVIKTPKGKTVTLKCLAFERHEVMAKEFLRIVGEAIPFYCEWFADFPYEQLTICESFFGWNGNECAGLIMIDERVFGSPHLATGYAEYLVSHETCHQWWYNLVGTNGYSETFMDEGAATYFTHKMLDKKLGRNSPFMKWPKEAEWLPNINRENYRNASMMAAIGKHQMQPAAQEMPGYGHLVGLFTGAYDRGSKAYGMIEARLGPAEFQQFLHQLFQKYSWRMLQAKDLKSELEAFTGLKWDEFFDTMIFGKGVTDWKIESVTTKSRTHTMLGSVGPRNVYRIAVAQTAADLELTTVGISMAEGDGFPIRVPVGGPGTPMDGRGLSNGPIVLEDGPGKYVVQIELTGEPAQITVDPDRVLLDANPGNNSWKNPPRVTVSPLYTMLNETDLTNDYDRWNFGGGPWVGGSLYQDPWYVRSSMLGVRAGAYRTQTFNGGVYGAYRTDYRDLVIGADGQWEHWPFPKSQSGFNVERRVGGPYGDVNGSDSATRAAAWSRYVLQYGASLYLPPMHYVEIFSTYQDNFLPFARNVVNGSQRPDWTHLTGIHHRLNLYTPYWDPECGVWSDLIYGAGVADLGTRDTMHQVRAELAFVKPVFCHRRDCLGPLADTRLAVRAVGQAATPQQGQFFALGGGTLFRGYDLAERQGSLLWVGNAELRVPLVREVEWDALDHTVGVRNVWLAAFYDVGAVYSNGRSVGGVAHAVGMGLRVDTAIFSFIERATLRLDFGKTLNSPTPFQFWFGVQHAF